MDTWAQRHRAAAPRLSPSDLRRLVRQWMQRARREKSQHDWGAAMRAVEQCPPLATEARALHQLFASEAELIWYICRDACQAHAGPTPLEDVLQDAWILFLRSLLAWRPSERTLKRHLRRTFRDKVKDHLATSEEPPAPDPDRRAPAADRSVAPPEVSIASLYDELAESGHVPDEARRLWQAAAPKDVRA